MALICVILVLPANWIGGGQVACAMAAREDYAAATAVRALPFAHMCSMLLLHRCSYNLTDIFCALPGRKTGKLLPLLIVTTVCEERC